MVGREDSAPRGTREDSASSGTQKDSAPRGTRDISVEGPLWWTVTVTSGGMHRVYIVRKTAGTQYMMSKLTPGMVKTG